MSRSNSAPGVRGAGGPDDVDAPKPPAHYAQRADAGDETWIEDAIEDYLGIRVGEAQRRICRAVAANKQLLVVSANSLGKSYILAAITIVWLFCRYPAAAFATSGTERKMKRTFCKPVESLHGDARIPLPGEYKSRPERIEIDGEPEHFFEASSPRDAGELEGVHNAFTLSMIEEADKPAVDEDVIEAMRSLATDDRDRLILIANPPEDETNSIYPLMDDHPNWEVIRFSTFDAHNVQAELGNIDAPKIDGIAGISKLEDDWVEHNNTPWPGIETALRVSAPKLDEDGDLVFERDDDLQDNPDFRANLSKRWYRRRAGIMPPEGASVHRPYGAGTAKEAYTDPLTVEPRKPLGTGIDVAGPGSDETVLITYWSPGVFTVRYTAQNTDYPEQEQEIMDDSRLGGDHRHPVAVDAAGEGSGLAGYLDDRWPDVYRFGSGKKPLTEGTADGNSYGQINYEDQRAEALAALGDVLEDVQYADRDLRDQLVIGGRTIENDTKTLNSRGEHGAEVVTVNSKSVIEERLGHSPDYLDAAAQAVWAAECTDQDLSPDDIVVL